MELAFRSAKTFIFTPRFFYTVEKLHCRADRVVAPSGSRQYLSVCRRNFPMQGDVAPKAWNCSKTFMSKTIEGAHCSHTLGRKSILFAIKVLGFLRGFFKIPLSRCGQSPRPLEPIGWWAPAVRLGTRFLFRENFHLHTTM